MSLLEIATHRFRSLRGIPVQYLAFYIALAALYLLSGVSRDVTNVLLKMFPILLELAAAHHVAQAHSFLTDKPHVPFADIREVVKQLDIDPDIRVYASCPRCSAIYAATSTKDGTQYPNKCSFDKCSQKLLSANGRPLRPYGYQPLASWLHSFLSRTDIVEAIEKNMEHWKNAASVDYRDIFFSPGLRTFLGPDKKPFLDAPQGEMRLVFGLNVDWFNPHGNKAAGKSYSVGGIYLACLNLPVHLRYKPENIYLAGIIPGPREPHLYETNHFLELLVDDLLPLWPIYWLGESTRSHCPLRRHCADR